MILVGFLSALIVVATTFQPLRADRIVAEGCGQRPLVPDLDSVSTFVVGGTVVDPAFSYPWMCSLQHLEKDKHVCACSLIKNLQGKYYVLTAAHCVWKNSVNESEALVGAHNISDKTESSRQTLKFSRMDVHPQYNDNTTENDIAIFSLENQPVENDYVQPVCIPNKTYTAGDKSVVTGWGKTRSDGNSSEVLLEGHKPIVSDEACAKDYADFYIKFNAESMVCAGYRNGGVDACQGDSGGPLVVYQNGEYQQVGIVSWGKGCAKANYPGVYADVYNLRGWINKIINI